MEDNLSKQLMDEGEKFKCIEAWTEEFGDPLRNPMDVGSDLFERFTAFRDALWQLHYRALSTEDQRLLDTGMHPSLEHSRINEALPFVRDLKQELLGLDYVKDVGVGVYHGDTLVLQVNLSRLVSWKEYRAHIPQLFRGFMVFVVPPIDA
jgi:hypothetical protein